MPAQVLILLEREGEQIPGLLHFLTLKSLANSTGIQKETAVYSSSVRGHRFIFKIPVGSTQRWGMVKERNKRHIKDMTLDLKPSSNVKLL